MRVAIFRTDSSSQDPDSYNSQEMGLAKGLSKLGHFVDIIMASSTGHYSEKVIDDTGGAIRIIELPFRIIPLLDEPFYPKVHRILGKKKYDYVQINEEGNFASYLIARVCNKNDLKFGIYQGMYRTLSGRKWALYEAIHHRFFRPFLRTRSLGAFCKTSLASDYLSSKGYKKTHVVPVGLDFSKFRNRKNRDWRTHLNIGADAQLILYVGSLEKRRNPQFIADLARNARADQHFVLVGRGPCQPDVETAIIKNSKKNLHLVGQLSQEELPALYEQADVFVLPSDYEIYGMVVAESLAFGTPVVSTRTAGPVDIIESEEQGRLISYLDVNEWLTAIDFYGISSKKKNEMGLRITNAESRFDWVSIARKYVELVS